MRYGASKRPISMQKPVGRDGGSGLSKCRGQCAHDTKFSSTLGMRATPRRGGDRPHPTQHAFRGTYPYLLVPTLLEEAVLHAWPCLRDSLCAYPASDWPERGVETRQKHSLYRLRKAGSGMHVGGPEGPRIDISTCASLVASSLLPSAREVARRCESLICRACSDMAHTHSDRELSAVLRSHNWESSVPGVQPLMQNHPADRRHAETVPRPGCRDVQELEQGTTRWPVTPIIMRVRRPKLTANLAGVCIVNLCGKAVLWRCMTLRREE